MASKQLKTVLEIIKSAPNTRGATVDQMRARMEKISERVAKDVACKPVDAAGVPGEWIVPPGSADDQVILYLHGGGYVMGSIHTHRAMIARIARASKARALALNYRLAPEHPFPAAVEDALAAYRWLLELGHRGSSIAVAGDSAGGGLALATVVALRDSGTPLPAAIVAMSPWTDLAATGASITSNAANDVMVCKEDLLWMAGMYFGKNNPKTPLVSPLYADLYRLPPLLVQVGSAEILLDDATRTAECARAAGVQVELEVWEEMLHGWHLFAKLLPEGQQAIGRIGEFVLAHTA